MRLILFLFFAFISQSIADDRANLASYITVLKTSSDKILDGYHLPSNYIEGYYVRRIQPYQDRVTYIGVENPKILFRGMIINIGQLINILEKGLELSRVRWTTLNGGVSFSTDENEARDYIFQNGFKEKGIGVVFKVYKREYMTLITDPKLNPTNSIYKAFQDVPASDIVDVYLWGRWGLESLSEIADKIAKGKVVPHIEWTGQFDVSPR